MFSRAYDGIARQSRAVFVDIAGNDGPGASIGSPGSGHNGITVGALGNDLGNPPFGEIASFSTSGAQDYDGPDGSVPAVRAAVDIVAPGENLTLAFYGGTTGGNNTGIDVSNGATNSYTSNAAGTSFAAPTVAGGATLLVDVAYDRFASNIANAKDGQVIKSVLLNSASKPVGWDNGQTLDANNVIRTSQALDFDLGAGALDLDSAFDQFTQGTNDVLGLGGGVVESTGWDCVIEEDGIIDYVLSDTLSEGSLFKATLNWFVGRTHVETLDSGEIIATDDYFTDLRLELWSLADGIASDLVAISDADFINTEHFAFQLPSTDDYLLRVAWDGERYDLVGNTSQTFGLAWSVTAVPEPAAFPILLMATLYTMLICRRKRVAMAAP